MYTQYIISKDVDAEVVVDDRGGSMMSLRLDDQANVRHAELSIIFMSTVEARRIRDLLSEALEAVEEFEIERARALEAQRTPLALPAKVVEVA